MKLLKAAFTLSLFFSLAGGLAHAQNTPRFEVGGHLFSFDGNEQGQGYGGGARFTYNVKNYLAFDSEIDGFFADDGRTYATQGLFGAKVGKRTKYFGVFAKARPGYSTFFVVNGDPRANPKFVLDVGGVVEAYPTRHLQLRLDVGDTIFPLGSDTVQVGTGFRRGGALHNLQVSFGLGIRF